MTNLVSNPVLSAHALDIAGELVLRLSGMDETVSGAESCTAGLAAALVACVPGASAVLWGSFVTYTEDAKEKMLGIPGELIREQGPVSRSVAEAMALKALEKSGTSWAFSITGLAGPSGDGSPTPIGTVWIGIAGRGAGKRDQFQVEAKRHHFTGTRDDIRSASAIAALEALLEKLQR